jgi:hypothetical protein
MSLRLMAVLCALAAGCVTTAEYAVPDCQAAMNGCMARCNTPPAVSQAQIFDGAVETRPPCEQRCEHACSH